MRCYNSFLKFGFLLSSAFLLPSCGKLGEVDGEDWSEPEAFSQNDCNTKRARYAQSTNPLVRQGIESACKAYKQGQEKRCADFVSTMIQKSNLNVENFKWTAAVSGLAQLGTEVKGIESLMPGDLVIFKNTYMIGPTTHVGIYVGDNLMVHRPTKSRPVSFSHSSTWGNTFSMGRRLTTPDWNRLTVRSFTLKKAVHKSVFKSNTQQSSSNNTKCNITADTVLNVYVASRTSKHHYVKVKSIENAPGCSAGMMGYLFEDHFN